MSVTFITGREVIMAAKKAATWRTAIECGANDGVLITGGFSAAKAPTYAPDDSLGQADIKNYYKTSENVSDSIDGYLRYRGWDVLMALALGTAGTPSQVAGTAYSNTYSPADNNADKFATLAMKKSPNTNGIWEVPSAKITGFEISAKIGELAKIKINFMGNKIELDATDCVNTLATMANVTYPDSGNIARMNDVFKMRMNAQAGAALADSDKIYPNRFTLTYNRPMDASYEAGYNDMGEPVQSGYSDASLKIDFDRYNLDTFLDAIEAETQYKMDLTFRGDLITGSTYYLIRIDIPKLMRLSGDAPVSGPGKISHSVTGRCLGVTSAPTGMSGVVDPISIYVVNTLTTDPLA
ncbi:MAG: phage tail tube protein [Candidatus Omnitrophica bacterium]|nr:phage tail tube protein [Candidatus Omnitrophota bacterium]